MPLLLGQGIIALSETDVSGWTDEQWAMLWESEMQLEDVFQLVSPDQVRHIRASRPQNLALFFAKVTATSLSLIESEPLAAARGGTSLATVAVRPHDNGRNFVSFTGCRDAAESRHRS